MIRITIEQTEPWPHENNAARTKDTKVFEQTVESLDIPAVIAVINGLHRTPVLPSGFPARCNVVLGLHETDDALDIPKQCILPNGHKSPHATRGIAGEVLLEMYELEKKPTSSFM